MAERDSNTTNPSDNLPLIEAATLEARADLAIHAIRIEVADSTGAGFAFLLAPLQTRDFVMRLLSELGAFVP